MCIVFNYLTFPNYVETFLINCWFFARTNHSNWIAAWSHTHTCTIHTHNNNTNATKDDRTWSANKVKLCHNHTRKTSIYQLWIFHSLKSIQQATKSRNVLHVLSMCVSVCMCDWRTIMDERVNERTHVTPKEIVAIFCFSQWFADLFDDNIAI